jgi:hypothetical protein
VNLYACHSSNCHPVNVDDSMACVQMQNVGVFAIGCVETVHEGANIRWVAHELAWRLARAPQAELHGRLGTNYGARFAGALPGFGPTVRDPVRDLGLGLGFMQSGFRSPHA